MTQKVLKSLTEGHSGRFDLNNHVIKFQFHQLLKKLGQQSKHRKKYRLSGRNRLVLTVLLSATKFDCILYFTKTSIPIQDQFQIG